MVEERIGDRHQGGSRRPLVFLASVPAMAGVALVLGLVLFGSESQLLACLKDDGFYYLVLARNIATGHGATFDGLGPTNGFHPLWVMCLTPLFAGDPESHFGPVRGMIVLALAFHLGAALAVRAAVDRIAGRSIANLSAWLYAGNPLALYLVVSGMESPVVALTVAMLAAAAVGLQRGQMDLTRTGDALLVGLLCGLCMLARTDLILLAGLVLAQAVLWPAPAAAVAWPTRWRGAVVAGLAALATVAPWLGWNIWRFGSVVQVSALAHHLHAESLRGAAQDSGLAGLLAIGGRLVEVHRGSLGQRLPLPGPAIIAGELVTLTIAAWWLWGMVSPGATRQRSWERLRWLGAPIVYATGFVAASFLVLGNFRSWYAAGPLTVAAIAAAVPFECALAGRPAPRRLRLASRLVSAGYVLGMLALGPVFLGEIRYEAAKTNCWREAADVVAARTGPGERAAAFNAGTFGYLAPRTVVNLDCVVNNRALPYLEEKHLPDFVSSNGIRVIIDDPGYVKRYYRVYSELGWRGYLDAADTLASGLVLFRVK